MSVTDIVEHEDRYHITAGPAPPDARTLVLKHGETFGIFNVTGDIDRRSNFIQGLFAQGMRHLSRLEVRIENQRLLLLCSKVTEDNSRIIIDLTNPDLGGDGRLMLPHGSLHLSRSIFLRDNTCFERLCLSNYALEPVDVTLSIFYDGDFADIFEIRGTHRERRGTLLNSHVEDDCVVLGYAGLDGVTRRSRIHCSPAPQWISESEVRFRVALPARGREFFDFTVHCEPANSAQTPSYDDHAHRIVDEIREYEQRTCIIDSHNTTLNQWLRRSQSDIRTLITRTEYGEYPYAGIPWYSTPFGRDGIITALQLLWVNPDVARGVLAYLAATQATEVDDVRDAEPGKILHEHRTNETAATGEVPFGQYYGSVDATPLFICLAGAYYQATGDLAFIKSIWSNIDAALNWIDIYGDVDGDGFIDYLPKTPDSLANQGWKDSQDAVFDDAGNLAQPPIALCEVQGCVYDAKLQAARLARVMGLHERADALNSQAQHLRERFNRSYWSEELGMYALALDGDKRPCRVRTSNPGHCLFSGIADEAFAPRICEQLLAQDMFSGWGIRTVGTNEPRYNPMSYHNGSIWPHDNAMIAMGFARYGFHDAVLRVFRGWFDASKYFELHRLPELFCGFGRHRGKGPTLYPVACSPQAWAAGSVFMMLAACLGLSIDGVNRRVLIHRPRMPRAVDEIRLRNLRVGQASMDLLFRRNRYDVGVLVIRKEGNVDLVVTK